MFRQTTQISTPIEALDELFDVQETLKGTAALTLALVHSSMHEPEAMRLIANLIDYCTITTEASCMIIRGNPHDGRV